MAGVCGGGGIHGRGGMHVCVAGETATAADGTHPTAIQSCLTTSLSFVREGSIFSCVCLSVSMHATGMHSCSL